MDNKEIKGLIQGWTSWGKVNESAREGLLQGLRAALQEEQATGAPTGENLILWKVTELAIAYLEDVGRTAN